MLSNILKAELNGIQIYYGWTMFDTLVYFNWNYNRVNPIFIDRSRERKRENNTTRSRHIHWERISKIYVARVEDVRHLCNSSMNTYFPSFTKTMKGKDDPIPDDLPYAGDYFHLEWHNQCNYFFGTILRMMIPIGFFSLRYINELSSLCFQTELLFYFSY